MKMETYSFTLEDFSTGQLSFGIQLSQTDVIALSVNKLTTDKLNTHYHPQWDNYTYFGTESKWYFGGVGSFARNTRTYNIIIDLNCSEYWLFEMLWFDLSYTGKNAEKLPYPIIPHIRPGAYICKILLIYTNFRNKRF